MNAVLPIPDHAIAAAIKPSTAPVSFQVRHGVHKVTCLVPAEVLEAASALPSQSSEQMHRRSFDRFRTLIEAAAQQRLAVLPRDHRDPITLTAIDLRRVPPAVGMPNFAQPARRDGGI